jgi:ribosomal protein S26
VEVRFENVFDLHALSFRAVQVRLYFPQGINNGSLSVAGNVISSLSKTARIDLFDFHSVEYGSNVITDCGVYCLTIVRLRGKEKRELWYAKSFLLQRKKAAEAAF